MIKDILTFIILIEYMVIIIRQVIKDYKNLK
jgi:hypothetical protein|nr:MAG TPA: FeoB-associated Cys-rich membrane protein [Caudoviricetes sp.]